MKKLFIPFSLSLFLLSQGCVDNQYDGDIDMNVQLAGNGLSAPIGETSKFTLNDLIGEDDNLKIDGENAYYISETSNSTAEFPTLDPFDITEGLKPEINPTGLHIPPALQQAVAGGYGWTGDISNVPIKSEATLQPVGIDVPDELRYIDTTYFKEPQLATLTFRVKLFERIGDGNSFGFSLSDLKGDLPKMLILSDGSDKGTTTLLTSNDKEVVVTKHHFEISGTTTADDGVFTLQIPIYGIYGRNYFQIKDGKLNIVDNHFSVEGTANIHVEIPNKGPERAQLLSTPVIATEFEIEDLTISHVFGVVDASAKETFSIEIGSMPDFLNDDGVVLDLYPYIKLHATNPMGVPVKASLSITPKTENGISADPITADIDVPQATYNPSTQLMDRKICNFYFSDNEPEGYKNGYVNVNDTLYTWVQIALSDLLKNGVPESLDVVINAQSDTTKEHEIVLANTPNNVDVDCDMTVPMEFGKDLLINYSDVITGLDDVFQDFSLEEAMINITDTTTLPLDLTISLWGMEEVSENDYTTHKNEVGNDGEPLYVEDEDEDENGNGNKYVHYYKVLEGINIAVLGGEGNSGTIKGCDDSSLNPRPAVGKVIASLKALDPDALKKVSAIRYKLSGKPANTSNATGAVGTLRSTQYLKLKMTATISGVSVDLDSL